jgi:hypothetical protein
VRVLGSARLWGEMACVGGAAAQALLSPPLDHRMIGTGFPAVRTTGRRAWIVETRAGSGLPLDTVWAVPPIGGRRPLDR